MSRLPATHVYLAERDGCVKIGSTCQPALRLRGSRVCDAARPRRVSVGPVKVLALFPGTHKDERALHEQFAAERLDRLDVWGINTGPTEWFELSDRIRQFVASITYKAAA